MSADVHASKVLGSWKEIASYLGKGVRTVQRWERYFGLPVQRPNSQTKGIVYARPEDLDHWLVNNWACRTSTSLRSNGDHAQTLIARPSTLHLNIHAAHELRDANVRLIQDLFRLARVSAQECASLAAGTASQAVRPTKSDGADLPNTPLAEMSEGPSSG